MKTSRTIAPLQIAELEWTPEGLPYSPGYGDLYFSRENGLAETRHTFLDGNRLAERFAQLEPGAQFSILETGFGTGLNFLATLQSWQQRAEPSAHLDFISIEAHPLSLNDLKRSLSLWPELQPQVELLVAAYPHLTPGFHCLQITENVRLILVLAEVGDALQQLAGPAHPDLPPAISNRVDAWYLDGFAPRVNPDMWDLGLFPLVAALSKPGSSLATFTSAGAVRRALQDVGFQVDRVPGYGRKREMLTANLERGAEVTILTPDRRKPLATWSLSTPTAAPQQVAILGAGIAGVSLAHRLALEGIEVTLIDAQADAMQRASGNAQAALFARLSIEPGDLEDFALAALDHASRYYSALDDDQAFHRCGLIQLPRKASEAAAMQKIAQRFTAATSLVTFQSAHQLSELAGIPLDSDGLWMPASGWINPAALAQRLLQHPRITTQFGHAVSRIEQHQGQWQLFDNHDALIHQSPCLVVCGGHSSRQLGGLDWLPTRPIRGQVSLIHHEQLKPLRTVICAQGYLAPEHQGVHSLGATYDLDSDTDELLDQDDQYNLEVLRQLTGIENAELVGGRSGVRCATPDYLPICGPAPDRAALQQDFAGLEKDAKRHIAQVGATLPGLYLNLGYGSRGFCYAPLCAEYLVSHMLARPSPLPHYLSAALHPARFIIRAMIRGKNPS